MIQFEQVTKTYDLGNPQKKALSAISLEITAKECFGIVGPSGSGKSTLLRLINQLETPDTGHLMLDDEDVSRLSAKEQRLKRQSIGMIFQQFNLRQCGIAFETTREDQTKACNGDHGLC